MEQRAITFEALTKLRSRHKPFSLAFSAKGMAFDQMVLFAR
jgi:hypothetical protein